MEGAWTAQHVAHAQRTKRHFFNEVKNTNAVIELAANSSFASFKEQLSKPPKEQAST
jgi:hypothetical protein